MTDTFSIEADDSEIIVGNGRVDVSQEKWMAMINKIHSLEQQLKEVENRCGCLEVQNARQREIILGRSN